MRFSIDYYFHFIKNTDSLLFGLVPFTINQNVYNS